MEALPAWSRRDMADKRLNPVLQHIRGSVASQRVRKLSDSELLRFYIRDRDQDAFAALVQRHGKLVWNVVRHELHHHQDAEDAFQATFLVLARKATSISNKGSIASWLHGVALR